VGRQAEPSDARGVHLVRHGESLSSIARKILGPGATDAQVASYVKRLWGLNSHRIGSGDPDLIYAGTRLRLPPA